MGDLGQIISILIGIAGVWCYFSTRERGIELGKREIALDYREVALMEREAAMDVPLCEFINAIEAANPDRHHKTLGRRIQKIAEELGEVNEAHLNVTSAMNAKGKVWPEVREEAIDTAIVAIDVALTPFPDETLTPEEIKRDVMRVLREKLLKWAKGRSTQRAATQTLDDAV